MSAYVGNPEGQIGDRQATAAVQPEKLNLQAAPILGSLRGRHTFRVRCNEEISQVTELSVG